MKTKKSTYKAWTTLKEDQDNFLLLEMFHNQSKWVFFLIVYFTQDDIYKSSQASITYKMLLPCVG